MTYERWMITALLAAALAVGCDSDDSGAKGGGPADDQSSENDGAAGDSGGPGASLGTPAPCDNDDDCPEGKGCIIEQGEQSGYCDVDEMVPSSSAAPAPCGGDDECPEGIACVIAEGESLGFCDVAEMSSGS